MREGRGRRSRGPGYEGQPNAHRGKRKDVPEMFTENSFTFRVHAARAYSPAGASSPPHVTGRTGA